MNTVKYEFKRVYAEIFGEVRGIEKPLDSVSPGILVFLTRQKFWQNSDGMNMLRSIFEGYAPSVIIAMIGYAVIGGSALSWIAFVWVFGALFTVATAYLRTSAVAPSMTTRPLRQMENC